MYNFNEEYYYKIRPFFCHFFPGTGASRNVVIFVVLREGKSPRVGRGRGSPNKLFTAESWVPGKVSQNEIFKMAVHLSGKRSYFTSLRCREKLQRIKRTWKRCFETSNRSFQDRNIVQNAGFPHCSLFVLYPSRASSSRRYGAGLIFY